MIVYLSGPMSGLPGFNFAAFDDAEKLWTTKGCHVLSPAQTSRAVGYSEKDDPNLKLSRDARKHLLLIDISCLFYADAIAMLPGWQNSVGATAELALAQFLGLKVFDAVSMNEINPQSRPWKNYSTPVPAHIPAHDGKFEIIDPVGENPACGVNF